MSAERLEGPRAEIFLAAAISLAREAATSPTWFEISVRALEAAYTERTLLPAPTLAFDLTALLHGERLQPVPPAGPSLVREALRGYEDHILARLVADRRWTRLTEAVVSVPKKLRATAVGLITAQLLERLRLSEGTGVSTGVVRRFTTRPAHEVLEQGRTSLYDQQIAALIAQGLNQLSVAARRTRELLSDAEVFLMENLAALRSLGARVALAQVAEVAQAVDELLPARLRSLHGEVGEVPTRLEDDSVYPVGGFSSLSTQGSLENLVTSELIYMDMGSNAEVRPDLFDVRFVESELLYYGRDESVAVRRKRKLVLVLDASLERCRVKDAGESYQRLVWLLGSITALIRKLSQWLSSEALRFEVIFTSEGDEMALREEEGVLSLLLREYRERGHLEVRAGAHVVAAVIAAREPDPARTQVMLFTSKMPQGLEGEAAVDAIIEAGGPRPRILWSAATGREEATHSSALEAWAETTRQLLDGFLRRRL